MSSGWRTLRELDQTSGTPKGTAFRAFKRLEPELRDGTDYRLLHAGTEMAEIAELRAARRIYDSSRNVLLLSPTLADTLLASLRAGCTG